MKLGIVKFIFTIFIIGKMVFFVSPLQAQEKKILIGEYLSLLEKKFGIKFSYNDNLIKKRFIANNINEVLENNLKNLEDNFFIHSRKINNRYFILSEKEITAKVFVYDKVDNKPIFPAYIVSSIKKDTIKTNEKGQFNIQKIAYNDTLQVFSLGYETNSIAITDLKKTNPKIYLKKSNLLEEVTVNANDTNISINPILGYTWDKEKISANLGKPDVFENIQFFPGISNPVENAGEIFIRGGDQGQNAVIYNGIKLYQTSFFFGAFSIFNLNDIENIKIYKGNTDVTYGHHVSGVIDINTDENIPKKTEANIGIDMLQYNASLKLPLSKKLSFSFSANKNLAHKTETYTKIFDRITQNTRLVPNPNGSISQKNTSKFDVSFVNFTSNINFKPNNKHSFTLNTIKNANEIDIYNTHRTLEETKNFGSALNWVYQQKEKSNLKTTLYTSSYQFDLNEYYPNNQVNLRNDIKDYGVKTVFSTQYSNNSFLSGGYEFLNQKIQIEGNISNEYVKQNNTHSLFLTYKRDNKNTLYSLGLRTNHNSLTDKMTFSPRIYFQKKLFPKLHLKTGIEFKEQNANQSLLLGATNVKTYQWSFLENHTNMRSKQYSIGLIFDKKDFLLDLELYKKHVSGIKGTRIEILAGAFFANYLGETNVTGIDVLFNKKISNNLNTTLSYSWSKALYKFDKINNGIPFSSDFDATHNLNWLHTLSFDKVSFSIAWLFRTGLPYSTHREKPSNNNFGIENINFNAERLSNYSRIDLSIHYPFFIGKKVKGKLNLFLQNLLDQKIVIRKELLMGASRHSEYLSQSYTPNISIEFQLL